MSLPLRECGLKSVACRAIREWDLVTPLAGVWIEMLQWEQRNIVMKVTPLAGVWIEINISPRN